MPSQIYDKEFGEITVKRIHNARAIRLKITPNGSIVATLPKQGSLSLVQRLVDSSRAQLRTLVTKHRDSGPRIYRDNESIGSSHRISFIHKDVANVSIKRQGQTIQVTLPAEMPTDEDAAQDAVRGAIKKALKTEAKAYLPRRLEYLANTMGARYSSIRYTHAKGRWGSCSSKGTISLNIALMTLPHELIDYVLIHELSHTKQMNHSQTFWRLVEEYVPDYKHHRKQLKQHNPYL